MKPTLYDEVLTKESPIEQATMIAKQRQYIKSHLDLVGLTYEPVDITLIRERLDQDYRAIDVVIAYANIYHTKYDTAKHCLSTK